MAKENQDLEGLKININGHENEVIGVDLVEEQSSSDDKVVRIGLKDLQSGSTQCIEMNSSTAVLIIGKVFALPIDSIKNDLGDLVSDLSSRFSAGVKAFKKDPKE